MAIIRKLPIDPTERAAQRIEKAFETCRDRRGFAFWQDRRWWIEDGKKRVWAVRTGMPGCVSSGLNFEVVSPFKLNGAETNRPRRVYARRAGNK
jgi:hypothetical protein